MDAAIAIGQGLGLAAAAGLLAAGALALTATAASEGWLRDPLSFAGREWLLALTWALVALEIAVDAIWPGAQAGARLWRRVVAGAIAFELAAGGEVPYAGIAIGALIAAAAGLTMRTIRSGAVKAGGDLRGTAMIEDGAGMGASILAVVPFVGYFLSAAAVAVWARLRRREDRKYGGLRVLR